MRGYRPLSHAALRRARAAACAAFAGLAIASAQTTLVSKSPFAPAAAQAGAAGAPSPGEAYELAGSSIQGSDVLVCIFDRQAKRSEWIPVGGASNGIHVLSYDAVRERAVVTVSGSQKELSLRKATVASAGPQQLQRAPSQTPSSKQAEFSMAQAPAPANETVAAKEQREARMLVSDLLEIGVQQRKAYQEAKQKAASAPTPTPSN
jgi:hypothetical protein